MNDRDKFNRVAKNWVEDYAMDVEDYDQNIFMDFFYGIYDFCKFLFDQKDELIEYETHNLIPLEPE